MTVIMANADKIEPEIPTLNIIGFICWNFGAILGKGYLDWIAFVLVLIAFFVNLYVIRLYKNKGVRIQKTLKVQLVWSLVMIVTILFFRIAA